MISINLIRFFLNSTVAPNRASARARARDTPSHVYVPLSCFVHTSKLRLRSIFASLKAYTRANARSPECSLPFAGAFSFLNAA